MPKNGEEKKLHIFLLGVRGVGMIGRKETSPQWVFGPKETWGDKGREGTQKNEKMGRCLLWMVP